MNVDQSFMSNGLYPVFLLSPGAAQETSVPWKWTLLGRWAPQKGREAGEKRNAVTGGAKLVFSLHILDIKLLYPVLQAIQNWQIHLEQLQGI